MKAYNLYYKHTKLNKRPLSFEEAWELKKHKYCVVTNFNNQQKINMNDTHFVECTVL